MNMMKFKAPAGASRVSVQQQEFAVDADGTITVPDHFRVHLEHMGFKSLGPQGEQLPAVEGQRVQQKPDIAEIQPPPDELTVGTSSEEVEVGLPTTVPVKMVAAAAAKRANLSALMWNAQTPEQVDARIDAEVAVHKRINAKLKELEPMKPEDLRKWLKDQGADLTGVKNADLLVLAAKTLNDGEKA